MTTIVYRDGVMAGDTCVTGGDVRRGAHDKVFNTKAHGLFGCSGDAWASDKLLKWINGGADQNSKPDLADSKFSAMWVTESGLIMVFNELLFPTEIKTEFCAIGSGNEIALGAMAAGAGPYVAVRIACRFDVHSAEPITMRFLNGYDPEDSI